MSGGADGQYEIISYDMTTATEIFRSKSGPMFPKAALDGYLYLDWWDSRLGLVGGKRLIWRNGQPWLSSEGWAASGGKIDFDPTRRRFYQVTETSLRVFDAKTMAMVIYLPPPLEGTFERYDRTTDQLQFRLDGQLYVWPAGAIQLPEPEPLITSPVPTTSLRFLAISPNWPADQTLFGLWSHPSRIDNLVMRLNTCDERGDLLYISQDGGQTWARSLAGLGGDICGLINKVAVSPDYAHDQTLLASIIGFGIFKSTDGGKLWRPSGAGLSHMHILEIVFSPGFANDQTAFAFAWPPGDRFYRSTDGGHSWQLLDSPSRNIVLSPDFEQDHLLIGWDYMDSSKKLYMSRDRGDSWALMSNSPKGVGISMLSIAPLFSKWQTLFAYGRDYDQNQNALYRSMDGGHSWKVVLTELSSVKQLVYAPDIEVNPPVFLLAGETVYRSNDGGRTWAEFELPGGIVPTALAISPDFAQDGLLFVGTADGQVITVDGGQ
jgi:photosystem II stability/assembly factor-like uncharacterized protein